jgi:acyl carrier protein
LADLDQEIKTMVSKIIKVDESRINPNANIFSEYGVDSLLGVEILAGLDKKYGLDVPEQRIREIKTLNDIIRIAKELISKKAS